MGNMGSAHPLVEVNVSFKFEGNPSISKGVIERTRIGDGRTDRPTDRPTDATKRIQYRPPPHILWWGYNYLYSTRDCFLPAFRGPGTVTPRLAVTLTQPPKWHYSIFTWIINLSTFFVAIVDFNILGQTKTLIPKGKNHLKLVALHFPHGNIN